MKLYSAFNILRPHYIEVITLYKSISHMGYSAKKKISHMGSPNVMHNYFLHLSYLNIIITKYLIIIRYCNQ